LLKIVITRLVVVLKYEPKISHFADYRTKIVKYFAKGKKGGEEELYKFNSFCPKGK